MAKENPKRKLAYSLYMNTGMTQKEISESIDVSEKTICAWARAGSWDSLKTANAITEPELIANYYKILKMIQEKMMEVDSIDKMNSYADTISKIHAKIKTIKNNDFDLSARVLICEEIVDHMRRADPQHLKLFTGIMMNYLEEKAKELDAK